MEKRKVGSKKFYVGAAVRARPEHSFSTWGKRF